MDLSKFIPQSKCRVNSLKINPNIESVFYRKACKPVETEEIHYSFYKSYHLES